MWIAMGTISLLDQIKISPLKQIPSVRGDVWHALKSTDEYFQGFGEAYFSWIELGSIKAWKQHIRMTMNLLVPVGTVCFVFYDSERKSFRELRIGSHSYCRITVPPKIWFGFKGEGLCNKLSAKYFKHPMTQKKFYVCQKMKFCLIGKKIHESCLTGRRIWNALSRIHRIDSEANGANWRKANSLAHHAALCNLRA